MCRPVTSIIDLIKEVQIKMVTKTLTVQTCIKYFTCMYFFDNLSLKVVGLRA